MKTTVKIKTKSCSELDKCIMNHSGVVPIIYSSTPFDVVNFVTQINFNL